MAQNLLSALRASQSYEDEQAPSRTRGSDGALGTLTVKWRSHLFQVEDGFSPRYLIMTSQCV